MGIDRDQDFKSGIDSVKIGVLSSRCRVPWSGSRQVVEWNEGPGRRRVHGLGFGTYQWGSHRERLVGFGETPYRSRWDWVQLGWVQGRVP